MYVPTHAMSAAELYRAFKRICSDADEIAVNRCFMELWDIYSCRRFPDRLYLEHALHAVRLIHGEALWSRVLESAVWYQHSAARYQDVEQSVAIARKGLPALGMPKKDIETTIALIRGTIESGAPRGYDALSLADANTYAAYGVSWTRANEIIVLKVEQDDLTSDYIQRVIAEQLASVLSGKTYYSRTMLEKFGASTRQNARDTLRNLQYLGRDNPKRRTLR